MPKKSFALAASTALITLGVLAPAQALETNNFAPVNSESNTVVALKVADDGNFGECTGTAIAPQWVLTASHCIQHQAKATGAVRIGQGDKQRQVPIESWQVVGDEVALIKTAEDMGLDSYAQLDTEKPTSGTVTGYGWSAAGSGGQKQLPISSMKVTENFDGSDVFVAESTDGAQVLPGDSGADIFRDGKVTGVLVAGLLSDDQNPETTDPNAGSPSAAYNAVAAHRDQIKNIIEGKADTSSAANEEGETTFINPALLIGGGAALLAAIALTVFVLRPKNKKH